MNGLATRTARGGGRNGGKEKRTGRRTSLFRGGCCGINSVESRRAGGEGGEPSEGQRGVEDWEESGCVCMCVRRACTCDRVRERERERVGEGCTGTGLVKLARERQ